MARFSLFIDSLIEWIQTTIIVKAVAYLISQAKQIAVFGKVIHAVEGCLANID